MARLRFQDRERLAREYERYLVAIHGKSGTNSLLCWLQDVKGATLPQPEPKRGKAEKQD